ncbi:MAG: hypothetical protein NVS2B9_13710 [Myxococcales bacterium]
MSSAGWRGLARAHRVELLLFAFTLFAYALSSWTMLLRQSLAPHFVYQADAFLHGQLHLTVRPPNLNDWVFERGSWFVSFPPFPAVLMMPLVAVFGRELNDTAFTIVFGALNVALLYRLLRTLGETGEEGPAARGEWDHAVHALVFGFGTLAWSCAIRGEVWFTAETVGVTLTLLYLLAAVRARHPVLAGLLVACAAITRTPLAFSAIFFVLEAICDGRPVSLAQVREASRDPVRRERAARRLLLFALPIAAVAAPMAWMNAARFGNPFEFGHGHLYANRVNQQIQRYGLFHYQYLERNLHAAFTRLPEVTFHPFHLGFNGEGLSLLVTTPLFALLLWPDQRPRLHRALWLTAAAVAVPGFFYQNSGWYQFGFRFSLDYTPYLVVLLALGHRSMTPAWKALAWAGVAVNAWGAAVFNRQV